MTNPIAIALGLCIVSAIGADAYFNQASSLLFLAKKFVDLLEWMAFWR